MPTPSWGAIGNCQLMGEEGRFSPGVSPGKVDHSSVWGHTSENIWVAQSGLGKKRFKGWARKWHVDMGKVGGRSAKMIKTRCMKFSKTQLKKKKEQSSSRPQLLAVLPWPNSMESCTYTAPLIFMVIHYNISPIWIKKKPLMFKEVKLINDKIRIWTQFWCKFCDVHIS